MTAILALHLVSAGLWLGCILTEIAIERATDGSPERRLFIARVHARIDALVEIPAFVVVLATGAWMLPSVAWSPALGAKVAAGLAAVAFNVLCVGTVFQRRRLAEEGRFAEYEAVDHRQHRYGAVVLVGVLAALALGLWRA